MVVKKAYQTEWKWMMRVGGLEEQTMYVKKALIHFELSEMLSPDI